MKKLLFILAVLISAVSQGQYRTIAYPTTFTPSAGKMVIRGTTGDWEPVDSTNLFTAYRTALNARQPLITDLDLGSSNFLGFSTRSRIRSGTDGYFTMYNNAETGFTALRFGGTSASFPSLRINGTQIEAKLADNSDWSNLKARDLNATNDIYGIHIPGVATAADSVMVPNRSTGKFEVRKLSGTLDTAAALAAYQTALSDRINNATFDAFKYQRWSYGGPRANTTTLDFFSTTIAATGTATARTPANTGVFAQAERIGYISTTSTTNSQAGVRNNLLHHSLAQGFEWICGGGFSAGSTIAGLRGIAGYYSASTGLFSTATEPSAFTNCLFFGFDAGETQWTFMHNDGTGTCVKETLNGGTGFPTNTNNTDLFIFRIRTVAGSNSVYYQIINLNGGTEAHGTVTTELPSSTTLMGWQFGVNSGTTAATPAVDFTHLRYIAP